jgi:hypothetical protein
MLIAYAQAAPSDRLRIWVGVFGDAQPAQPVLGVNATSYAIETVAPLRAIRDGMLDGQGDSLNHRALYEITGLRPGVPWRVTVRAGDEKEHTLTASTLPLDLPGEFDQWFNILLCSCYSQPQDASGTLGRTIERIMTRPDLTFLMGDQIYGDLPLTEDLPNDNPGVARTLGRKYLLNWTSGALATGGLAAVLARAPVMCVADDHEYWNNYPFSQAQLPKTWTADGRDQWKQVARALYEDYQLGTSAGAAQRIDIGPLKMLMVDMRSDRDDELNRLLSDGTAAKVTAWENALHADRNNGLSCFGLLCSGQALFVAPKGRLGRTVADAEMSNYSEFDSLIVPALERLAAHGIPVVYVTGDVHWGRVAQARYRLSGADQMMIHEIIASPSCLIRSPGDGLKKARAKLAGWVGSKQPWPRHGEPDRVPDRLGKSTRFQLECDVPSERGYGRQGDQVAVLSLCKAGGGINFKVTYYSVSQSDAALSPYSTRVYSMRNL